MPNNSCEDRQEQNNHNILIVGGGAMGRALYDGWCKSNFPSSQMAILDQNQSLEMGNKAKIIADLKTPIVLVIAVKPQHVAAVLDQFNERVTDSDIVVSIAAGITLQSLRAQSNTMVSIFRVMPNLAVRETQGAIGICAENNCTDSAQRRVTDTFAHLGESYMVTEEHFDAFTALAGSGPAYLFQFVEHMAKGGATAGLPVEICEKLAAQVYLGSANLLENSNISPSEWRERVTSPGGTTQAGLEALNGDGHLAKLITDCLLQAKRRGKELSDAHQI